ncbi:hypothetical protein [Yoonia sp. SS1-5]|uniref:Uncharacterized protein n=1 Tax=Yoonia rhodophyticola TaxID=3137370 RepID=A0AAN0NJV4_9RHOB
MMTEFRAHIRARLGHRLALSLDSLVPVAAAGQARRHSVASAADIQDGMPFDSAVFQTQHVQPPAPSPERTTQTTRTQPPADMPARADRLTGQAPRPPALRLVSDQDDAPHPLPLDRDAPMHPAPAISGSMDAPTQTATTGADMPGATTDAAPSLLQQRMNADATATTPRVPNSPDTVLAAILRNAQSRRATMTYPFEGTFHLQRQSDATAHGTSHARLGGSATSDQLPRRVADPTLPVSPVGQAPSVMAIRTTSPDATSSLSPIAQLDAYLPRERIRPNASVSAPDKQSADRAETDDDFMFDQRLRAALSRILTDDLRRHGLGTDGEGW